MIPQVCVIDREVYFVRYYWERERCVCWVQCVRCFVCVGYGMCTVCGCRGVSFMSRQLGDTLCRQSAQPQEQLHPPESELSM